MKKIFLLIFAFCLFTSSISFSQCAAWTQKTNYGGVAVSCAIGFSIGTKGYIGTGIGGPGNDFWEWDLNNNFWTQKANLPGAFGRTRATGFSIGTMGYIGLGWDGQNYLKDFWEWNQATNTWFQKANFLGEPRQAAVSFSIGTKGYVGTGDTATIGKVYDDFWEWDQTTDTWTQKTNVPGGVRYGAVGFSIGAKGYIGTGANASGSPKKDFWEWDQATNTWTQKANFGGSARAGAAGFAIGTKGYIGTGQTTSSYVTDFWEWDQATNSWTQRANFGGVGRNQGVGFSVDSVGYIGTGYFPTSPYELQDFWEYYPNSTALSICLTTVDSLSSSFNQVVWEKPVTTLIDSFRIYRLTSSSYIAIATVPYSALSVYKDSSAGVNPITSSYIYRISSIDKMGVESLLSNAHETMWLQVTQPNPPGFNLIWTDYCGFPVTKYYIERDSNNTQSWVTIDSVNFGTNVFVDSFPPTDSAGYRIDAFPLQSCVASIKYPDPNATTVKGSKSNSDNKFTSVSVVEISSDDWLKVFPNPNHGNFTVSSIKHQVSGIQVYNMLGDLIYQKPVYDKKTEIKLPAVPSGIYHLQVITEKGIVNRKIVIE